MCACSASVRACILCNSRARASTTHGGRGRTTNQPTDRPPPPPYCRLSTRARCFSRTTVTRRSFGCNCSVFVGPYTGGGGVRSEKRLRAIIFYRYRYRPCRHIFLIGISKNRDDDDAGKFRFHYTAGINGKGNIYIYSMKGLIFNIR